ncbi:clavesin-1 [Diabrotica undecimpunctata]|uniref:clavesin-1 n=1 Tax=Diabrotica undecimpunctata TaxID=50387 RepID=UPI003B634F16
MTTSELIMVNSWNDHYNTDNCNIKITNKKLKKELYEVASRELRESESTRKECLEHLRNWIKQNPDIENCLTDDAFLLRFLRVKKFSIPMAEQTLLKYLNFRKRFSYFMDNLDCCHPNVSEIIGDGFIYVSPFRDTCGKRVVLYDVSKFNLQKFNGADLAKVFAITYETLTDDEENQILGVKHVGNLEKASLNYIPLFTATDFAIMIRWGEQSMPMRHKEINIINFPPYIKFVYEFMLSIASEKLKSRVNIHSSLEQLHKKVSKHCLPAELGGDMPEKEMIRLWKQELEAKRKRLLSYDEMNLLSDRGIIRRRKPPSIDETGSLAGSFRQLQVD